MKTLNVGEKELEVDDKKVERAVKKTDSCGARPNA